MADRVFIFHETTDNFRAFRFNGTAETSENWSPGFNTISGAAADHARIVVLDTSVSPAVARFFNAAQTRQAARDITMNSNDVYSAIALTDTHLVVINRTANKLEYYDLTTKAYDSTRDVTLPTLTNPGYFSGFCRHGNFLYLITHNDSTYSPRIYKRNLDGSAASDWAGQTATTALTIFATNDRLNTVRKNGGHWDRWAFDGTADTVINTIGAGLWAASYTTFESTAPPLPSAVTGQLLNYTPAITIEIEGVDVTDRLTRDAQGRWEPITIGQSLDHPKQSVFRNSLISFNLDNEDGAFDYSSPNNFFVPHNKPTHGRGAQVLVRLGLSKSEMIPAFAGQINEVQTSLGNTKARITIGGLSQKLNQSSVENFGEEITRRITDFDFASVDYDDLDPIFYFPVGLRRIVRGSVSVIVHESGGDVAINIVDVVGTSGVLSNRNAEIDYGRGLIRFEAPPTDGADTEITATWKVGYQYKRPDFLIRSLLKHSGLQTELGITDDKAARFSIEQALISHPTNPSFSSHGRPYLAENGVVRWMRRNGTIWQLIQDQRFIEYDEHQDEYTKIADLPSENGLGGIVNNNYGMYLTSESFNTAAVATNGIAVDASEKRIYVLERTRIVPYLLDGTSVESQAVNITTGRDVLAIDDDYFYTDAYAGSWSFRRYSRATGVEDTDFRKNTSYITNAATVTPTRIITTGVHNHIVVIWDMEGNRQRDEERAFRQAIAGTDNPSRLVYVRGMASNGNNIFVHTADDRGRAVVALTHAYVRVPDLDIQLQSGVGSNSDLSASDTRLYQIDKSLDPPKVNTYQLGTAVNFGGYVPYQFDTEDDDTFFFLTANNTQGNAVSSSTLRRVKIYKYVKSTNTWTELLNSVTGHPQLSQSYKFPGQQPIYLANNRKNFQVVQRNGKTLLFFRFASSTASGIRYWNDTDRTLTTVYTESHSGSQDYGLPYSMDFALDIRNDGIYVYTFVVRVQTDTSGNYAGGNLRVYRKRVEPNGSQSRIFAENFVQVTDEEDYPVSVSDLILADDRSKFYFTLEWHGEGNRPGKAELCTIAKAGSGGRKVIKSYANPLLSSRSPAKMGSRYFYLEGGWVRRPKDPDTAEETYPDDQYYYPNEGGKLIEIESNDAVTDHGQVWRSATKQDHPDADDDSPIHDGWGLFNAIISNIVVDERGNLHFVAGFGSPYNVDENLPFSSNREPVPSLANFQWLQWGKDLATKIASFPTGGARVWALIQQVAQIMNWEIGFGPDKRKVDAIQSAHGSITDWGANASLFFRPRTILPAKLRASIGASGTPSTIALNDSGLPAEASEFPVPPSGERYGVIVGREMFSYTGVTPDSSGRRLSGIQRAQNGSMAVGHSADGGVYFVDYFASGELGTTLVGIQTRSQDFVNLRNDVNVGYGQGTKNTKSQSSIDANGQFTLDIEGSLLSRFDEVWAELIGQAYCEQLCELKELLTFTLVFSPSLLPGQLLVLYQQDRIQIDFKLFKLLSVQHHIPRWQTGVTALEIV